MLGFIITLTCIQIHRKEFPNRSSEYILGTLWVHILLVHTALTAPTSGWHVSLLDKKLKGVLQS